MQSLLEISRREQPASPPEGPVQAGFYLGLGLALLCDFALAVQGGSVASSAAETIVAKIEGFIWQHYTEPLSLDEIARAVGVSRQHLLKVCRSEEKPTPMTQLYAARLEAATDLLRQTGLPINAVADKCGFISSSIFHESLRRLLDSVRLRGVKRSGGIRDIILPRG
jgi:AraC-like DNA-binding protein